MKKEQKCKMYDYLNTDTSHYCQNEMKINDYEEELLKDANYHSMYLNSDRVHPSSLNNQFDFKKEDQIIIKQKKVIEYLKRRIIKNEESSKQELKKKEENIIQLEEKIKQQKKELKKLKCTKKSPEDLKEQLPNMIFISSTAYNELIAENELIKRLNEEIRNQVNQYSKKEFDYNTQLKEVNNLKEMINEYTDIKEKLLTDAENSKKGLVSKEKELTQEYEREKIELQMEIDKLKNFNDLKKKEIDLLTIKIEFMAEENISLKQNESKNKDNFDGLSNRCNLLEDVVKKLEKDSQNKEKSIEELLREIEIYKANFNQFEESFNTISTEFNKQEKLINCLKKEKNEISKECQNYDIEIRLLKEKYNFLDQDYKETATELSIIKQEFQKLNEERESLFNEIRSLKQDNQILIRDRDRELKEKRVLNEENQKLNKLNYSLEEEIKSSKEENDNLFNEKDRLINENENLYNEKDIIMSEKEELITKLSILSEKMRGFNELYEDFSKSRDLEKDYITTIENKNKELIRKLENLEIQFNIEIEKMRSLENEKEFEFLQSKDQYEQTISMMKLKIIESNNANDYLVDEITKMKNTLKLIEQQFSEQNKYQTHNKNRLNYQNITESYPNQIVDNVKKMISQMENKIMNTHISSSNYINY